MSGGRKRNEHRKPDGGYHNGRHLGRPPPRLTQQHGVPLHKCRRSRPDGHRSARMRMSRLFRRRHLPGRIVPAAGRSRVRSPMSCAHAQEDLRNFACSRAPPAGHADRPDERGAVVLAVCGVLYASREAAHVKNAPKGFRPHGPAAWVPRLPLSSLRHGLVAQRAGLGRVGPVGFVHRRTWLA